MSDLERWGINWNAPHGPLVEQMPDGYWTPWFLADARLARAYALLNRAAWLLDGNTVEVGTAPKFVREVRAFLRDADTTRGTEV